MIPSFVLACAATVLIAFGASLLSALALWSFGPTLSKRAPAAQARVVLAVSLLPAVFALAVITAALAPSFGWIADHCHSGLDPHSHPHICAQHERDLPSWSTLVLAGLLAFRLLVATHRGVSLALTARRTERLLASQVSSRARVEGAGLGAAHVRVLPMPGARAFVFGLLHPRIYVTAGLLEAGQNHLAAAIAHERAHLRRADGLRRVIAALGLVFHVPGIARHLERALARLHERAADEEAALELGSRTAIADALLFVAREPGCAPHPVLAFTHSDVEARVVALLEDAPNLDRPTATELFVAALIGLLAIGVSAEAVHHGVEMMLGLLAG